MPTWFSARLLPVSAPLTLIDRKVQVSTRFGGCRTMVKDGTSGQCQVCVPVHRTRDGCLDPTLFAAKNVACLASPPMAFLEASDRAEGEGRGRWLNLNGPSVFMRSSRCSRRIGRWSCCGSRTGVGTDVSPRSRPLPAIVACHCGGLGSGGWMRWRLTNPTTAARALGSGEAEDRR